MKGGFRKGEARGADHLVLAVDSPTSALSYLRDAVISISPISYYRQLPSSFVQENPSYSAKGGSM